MYTWPILHVQGGYQPYELSEFRSFELQDGQIVICEKLKNPFEFTQGDHHIIVYTEGIAYGNTSKDGDNVVCVKPSGETIKIPEESILQMWKKFHILPKMPD